MNKETLTGNFTFTIMSFFSLIIVAADPTPYLSASMKNTCSTDTLFIFASSLLHVSWQHP